MGTTVSKALLHLDGRKSDETQAKRIKRSEAATSVNEKSRQNTGRKAHRLKFKETLRGGSAGSWAAAHGPYSGSDSSAPPPGLRRESRCRFSAPGGHEVP
ncbi:hypothetical protein PAL_GLEAN10012369 [Pteropus alecto]|uniref:Uncharacterized protein n=1 Tax=Pteropus alecto TaxID=9402 RepID=L5KCU9_PTEAL|nr:hypothetical protein PAL_GLEAN10012369 [Pteropus alecto]